MCKFCLTDSFKTGDQNIDASHKLLIDKLNNLIHISSDASRSEMSSLFSSFHENLANLQSYKVEEMRVHDFAGIDHAISVYDQLFSVIENVSFASEDRMEWKEAIKNVLSRFVSCILLGDLGFSEYKNRDQFIAA